MRTAPLEPSDQRVVAVADAPELPQVRLLLLRRERAVDVCCCGVRGASNPQTRRAAAAGRRFLAQQPDAVLSELLPPQALSGPSTQPRGSSS